MCTRCNWTGKDKLMVEYHDNEWGVPLHDDNKLFEFLILESFQAGLSWKTILHRREAFRSALDGFNPEKIAGYTEEKVNSLMLNSSIIRNRNKIKASINNAICFLKIQDEYGSFDNFIWQFTDHRPIFNNFTETSQLPAKTAISEIISSQLIKKGFKFTGPVIVYAHMQATGMVNDHLTSCFRYEELKIQLQQTQ